MLTDIEIAHSVKPLPISEVAASAGVDQSHLIPYGFDKAKVDYSLLNEEATIRQNSFWSLRSIHSRGRGQRPPRLSVWQMHYVVVA